MRSIDQSKCKSCQACLKLGCPAIESTGKGTKPSINAELCAGCNLCEQVCAFAAIATTGAGAADGENTEVKA
jgi:indolepyruvate ferredoxin oxidoreductase alpha subunit